MAVNKVVFGAVAIMDISDSTVTEDTLAKGVTAYDKSGEKITGTMEQAADPTLQAKTVTPTTSSQTVKPDSGYDGLSQVTVSAMPTATQATPSITVSSAGLITAKATQSAGYVASGTKQATKQLTTQAAKTVTPTTSDQTAVASGRYTTGAITVKGDSNLVAGNIKSGVSIFGVAGTYEGSGGGGSGGGGSVETCEVMVHNDSESIIGVGITLYDDIDGLGYFSEDLFPHDSIALTGVLCGSSLVLLTDVYTSILINSQNADHIGGNAGCKIVEIGKNITSASIYVFADDMPPVPDIPDGPVGPA